MPNEQTSALKSMELLRALSAPEFDAIAAIARRRELASGGDLFHEGDAGDGLYLVVSGDINVIKQGPDGEHLLAKLGPGAVLGEMSLITSEARSATGRALAEAVVLHLPLAEFRALLDSGSTAALKITYAIAEVLARRLATMNGIVLGLTGRPEPGAKASSGMKTQDLKELHRTMQVWSF